MTDCYTYSNIFRFRFIYLVILQTQETSAKTKSGRCRCPIPPQYLNIYDNVKPYQIWHTYAYSSGNGHEVKISPLIPEGVRGSSIHKSGKASKPWTDQDQTWHTYRPTDSSGNGNMRTKSNPSSPLGHLKGVWGSQIQKCWKDAKQLDRL